MVPLSYYQALAAVLFTIGVLGVVTRRNAIVILLSIELMLNAANLSFIASSRQLGGLDGHVVALVVMTMAAAEVAVGLALIIVVARLWRTLRVDRLRLFHG
jgi:NADH-quinone oxidoreductase subunit K